MGYSVVCKSITEGISKVGPFYADCVPIAKALMHTMVHNTPQDILGDSFDINVPTEPNSEDGGKGAVCRS